VRSTFDTSADVVVVGCGYAGAVAAISAHDAGAKVIVLEAMPTCGGISVLSGGGVRTAQDEGAAFEYLQRSGGGRTPDEVWRSLARGMTAVSNYVSELALETGATVANRTTRSQVGRRSVTCLLMRFRGSTPGMNTKM
jgi:succinate dehydrogenase/fumarate reductase flavoprotein subunit